MANASTEPVPTIQTHSSSRNPFYCVSARKMRSGWRYQIQFWSTETSTTDPELVPRRSSHLPNQNTFYCVLARKMRLSPRYQLSVGGTGPRTVSSESAPTIQIHSPSSITVLLCSCSENGIWLAVPDSVLAVRGPMPGHGTGNNSTSKPRYKYLDPEIELLSDPWLNIGLRTLHTGLVLGPSHLLT